MSKTLLTILTFLAVAFHANAQDAQSILATATKANAYFMSKYTDPTQPSFVKKARPSSLWTRAVYYEGLMALNDVDPQKAYTDYTDCWASFHKWTPRNGVTTVHADDQCCCQIYLTRFMQVGGDEKMQSVKACFDNQMSRGTNRDWTWIDAIQMAMPAYAMLYKATGDRKYMDYAMQSYIWTRDTCGNGLLNKEVGLWWRDANFVPPYKENDGQNCYWSRGNGWVYAALCRVMDQLSPKDKYYKQLKSDYLLMSQALLKCQREDGFWNASLASQDFAGPELTGTSLFLYGLSWGMRHGFLKQKQYLPAAQKAWKAVESCVHNDGFLGYVQGSGDRPASGQPVTYVKEPDFDDYGTGCFLLGATEFYKLTK